MNSYWLLNVLHSLILYNEVMNVCEKKKDSNFAFNSLTVLAANVIGSARLVMIFATY